MPVPDPRPANPVWPRWPGPATDTPQALIAESLDTGGDAPLEPLNRPLLSPTPARPLVDVYEQALSTNDVWTISLPYVPDEVSIVQLVATGDVTITRGLTSRARLLGRMSLLLCTYQREYVITAAAASYVSVYATRGARAVRVGIGAP